MDSSPPASSVHGISQARILEWVAISSSSLHAYDHINTINFSHVSIMFLSLFAQMFVLPIVFNHFYYFLGLFFMITYLIYFQMHHYTRIFFPFSWISPYQTQEESFSSFQIVNHLLVSFGMMGTVSTSITFMFPKSRILLGTWCIIHSRHSCGMNG